MDWPALYRAVEKHAALGAVRFRAIFTDGGMVSTVKHCVLQTFRMRHVRSNSSSRTAQLMPLLSNCCTYRRQQRMWMHLE